MKIGLFGGTFNPIHRCHLFIASYVRDRLGLDRILFIPTGDPPHKPSGSLAPAHHRLNMVRLATADDPSFVASDIEIRRPTKSYSIETVRALRDDYGSGSELVFIIGLDAFLEFPTWREAPDLLRACHFAIVGRPRTSFLSLIHMSLLPPIDRRALAALDDREEQRVEVQIPGGTRLILLRMPPCEVSASVIRRRLKQHLTVSNLLPASVESYIMRVNLYQEASDHTGV